MTFQENLKQFLRFGTVGTVGAVVDFGSYALLTRILGWATVYCVSLSDWGISRHTLRTFADCAAPRYPVVAANMASVFLAIAVNFYLNKYWTFRNTDTSRIATQGARYFAMSVIAWVLNQLLTGFFASRLVMLHALFGASADIAAKVLAVFVVLFFNYGGSRLIVFRR